MLVVIAWVLLLGRPALADVIPREDEQPSDPRLEAVRQRLDAARGKSHEAERLSPQILELTESEDPSVRAASVHLAPLCFGMESGGGIFRARVKDLLISDPAPSVRRECALVLGFVDYTVVPHLSDALSDPDVSVRLAAVESLGRVRGWRGVDALVRALLDADPRVRGAAAYALGAYDEPLPQAVPALVSAIGRGTSRSEIGADPACAALGRVGDERAVDGLLAVVADPDNRFRRDALRALGHLRPWANRIVPVIEAELRSSEDHMRRSAAGAAADLGPKAAGAIPALVRLVEGRDSVLFPAVYALGRMGEHAAEAAPMLAEIAAGEDTPKDLRRAAVEAIARMGDAAAPWAPGIVQEWLAGAEHIPFFIIERLGPLAARAMVDELEVAGPERRRTLAAALSKLAELEPLDPQSLKELVPYFHDDDRDVARWVADAVAASSENARSIAPELVRMLERNHVDLPGWAAGCLLRAGAPEAGDPLRRAALRGRSSIRVLATEALGYIPEQAAESVPVLLALLEDHSSAVAGAAALSLGRLGYGREACIGALTPLLGDSDRYVSVAAAAALVMLGQYEQSLRVLAVAVGEDARKCPHEVFEALARAGPDATEIASLLVSRSKWLTGRHRELALDALAHMGPDARPIIRPLLRSEDYWVRKVARDALAALGEAAARTE